MSDAESGTRHVDQSRPYEWRAFEHGDNLFVSWDVPEGNTELFAVSAISKNPRTVCNADAVIYEGNVTDPVFDEETRTVRFIHDYAGRMGREQVGERLSEPVVRLKRLSATNLSEVLPEW